MKYRQQYNAATHIFAFYVIHKYKQNIEKTNWKIPWEQLIVVIRLSTTD